MNVELKKKTSSEATIHLAGFIIKTENKLFCLGKEFS